MTMEGPRLWLDRTHSSEPAGPAIGCRPESKQVALEPSRACAWLPSRGGQAPLSSIPAPLVSFLACEPRLTESCGLCLLSSPGLSVCLSVYLSCLVSLQNLHQLKQIQTLKQMNAQLQAENRALARVVARLSASMESAQSQEL